MTGMSLVELMIAMVIGLIVMLGVVQVFSASREAYRLSEGLARVQENSRFAMDSLQRDLRMAGHFGCINDQAHTLQNPGSLYSTLNISANPSLDFTHSIQGYEANDTEPGKAVALSTTPTTGGTAYSPALPSDLAAALTNRVDGSDIVALRFLMPDGVPVTSIAGDAQRPVFNFDASRLAVLQSGVTNAGLFGVADCLSATVFQARAVDTGAASVTFGDAPNNAGVFTSLYTTGQAMLYRAESIVLYVGYDADNAQSSLYRVRFTAGPNGNLIVGTPAPLAVWAGSTAHFGVPNRLHRSTGDGQGRSGVHERSSCRMASRGRSAARHGCLQSGPVLSQAGHWRRGVDDHGRDLHRAQRWPLARRLSKYGGDP